MSEKITREEIHHRALNLRFFRRSDGLHEVEGTLVDTKTHPFRRLLAEEETLPGQPLHDISVRLVVDADLKVHDAKAEMRVTPFGICSGAETTLAPLIGLRIGAGWNRHVRERLGGAASCTHVMELLGPMATAALQGLAPQQLASIHDPANESQRAAKVNSCYAFASDREVVARLWPHLSASREVPNDA